MGAGLAKQIRELEPTVFKEYKKYIEDRGSMAVYGTAQPVKTCSHIYINLFAQYNYGRNDWQYTSYDHMEAALNDMCDIFSEKRGIKYQSFQIPVAIPYDIGCGPAAAIGEL